MRIINVQIFNYYQLIITFFPKNRKYKLRIYYAKNIVKVI